VALVGHDDELHAVAGAELHQDPGDVGLGRERAGSKRVGDLGVGQTRRRGWSGPRRHLPFMRHHLASW